jgi:basic membrane lipoprotein Med (substrate-binding protein (PBP1-ABC) superfamily)
MKNRKFKWIVLLLMISSLFLTQCSGGEEVVTTTDKDDVFKVGLLSPGPAQDQGWNQLAYDSIMLIKQEMGAEVSYVEISDSPADIEKAFRDYAEQGYDMIIGHSFAHQDYAEIVAKDYPNVVFLTSGGEKFGENFAPVVFKENEVAYLMGIIAGHMTETGKAISIGGEEIPAIALPQEGFCAGFMTVEGNDCSTTYINSWEDITTGKEATLAGVAAGADVCCPNANLAGQGCFQVAQEEGLWAFGTNYDQRELAPDVIVASTVFDYPKAYLAIAKEIQAGTFKANRIIGVGLETEGAAYVAFNPDLKGKIPAEAMQKYEEALKLILSGDLDVPGKMIP